MLDTSTLYTKCAKVAKQASVESTIICCHGDFGVNRLGDGEDILRLKLKINSPAKDDSTLLRAFDEIFP